MISMILPAYNSEKTIGKCLESVFNQNYPKKNYEVVVIDDYSTDNTAKIISKYPCKLIKLNKHNGPANARNIGAKNAKGNIFFFIDSDTVLEKNSLSEIKKSFNDKNIKCITGMYKKYPENKGIFPLYKSFLWYHEMSNVKEEYVSVMNTACGAVKREVFLELKGFNTKYKDSGCEDVEFSRRLSNKYKIYLNKNLKVGHHYPTLIKGLKKSFKTYIHWWPLFLKRKKLDSAMTSKKLGIGTASAGLSFIFFIIALFFITKLFLILGTIFSIIFIYSYSAFYHFILKQNKSELAFMAIFISYLNSLVICAAIFLSSIKNGLKHN